MALTGFRNMYLPYCLERQKNGSYVVLNREYKPVGFNTEAWIEYKDFPVSATFKITRPLARRLSYNKDGNLERIFLYNDGCLPEKSNKNMNAYLIKIGLMTTLIFGN